MLFRSYAQKQQQVLKELKTARIHTAIAQYKPRDPSILAMMIDTDKVVELDGGKLAGLGEQVDAIKKDKAFLFEDQLPNRGGVGKTGGGQETGHTNAEVNSAIRMASGRL